MGGGHHHQSITGTSFAILSDCPRPTPIPPQMSLSAPSPTDQLLTSNSAHCYKRSAFKSSLYVAQDFVLLAALVYGAYHIDSFLSRL